MRANNALMLRVAEGQAGIAPALTRLAEKPDQRRRDAQPHRNPRHHLARLAEDVATGRTQATAELRNEIKILTRTIAAIAEETAAVTHGAAGVRRGPAPPYPRWEATASQTQDYLMGSLGEGLIG